MTIENETPDCRSYDLPDRLLHGAIDTHIHSGPWLRSCPGRMDPFQLAVAAREAGQRAVVFYDHTFGNSAGTAWMVSRQVDGIEVYGGLILTTCLGGMNPRAVKTALHYGAGAKFIHFGAHCTYYMASHEGRMINGAPVPFKDLYPKFAQEELSRAIRIPLEDPISPELDEILDLIAERPDVYLVTGHLSGPEAIRLCRLARDRGIARILVSHPARARLSLAEQKQLAAEGVFLEACCSDWLFHKGLRRTNYYVEPEWADEIAGIASEPAFDGFVGWAKQIREIGVEHFVVGTDYGIRSAPAPVEGMRLLASSLLDLGFPVQDIRRLIRDNPERLLGLSPERDTA
ncbi:DUF6282 family protein [Celeribacter indicus]|uniref:Amidohydrolase n=1 Tax=Celeribacter indicus TaxID=1208324 RepID=A0A0B5E709_9RHOB|nr:DUF6282 family protein [Celeribacter indicus]AJE48821.1 hypothetical protein P73_4106 [Celeribacter indicus]SDW38331.1 hypothetical protein SAMN05443573_10326 [Celeribacter indicus]